jgi:hypothetical protein
LAKALTQRVSTLWAVDKLQRLKRRRTMNKSACFRSKELTSIPPITDGHLLFVHSSALYVITFDYSQVAQSFTTWRHIGFTSFPFVPKSAAAVSTGLGTLYSP